MRRLRDWAGRAPERDAEGVEATSGLAAERAEEVRRVEEERRLREEAVAAEREAAEKREHRRQRREAGMPDQTRSERIRERLGGGTRRRGRLTESRYLVAAIIAVVVLGAAGAVAATQLGGDDEQNGGADVLRPSKVEVAVLNGTNPPVQGLAGTFGDRLEAGGFQIGVVSNSRNAFTESVVMFSRGFKPEATRVARRLQIPKVRMMTPDIRNDSAAATVSVVVGQDKAGVTG